jgi:hypothetical protein
MATRFSKKSFVQTPVNVGGVLDINEPVSEITESYSDVSPEGKIAAVPGSTCLVRGTPPSGDDGVWSKASGTGNTGWVRLLGGSAQINVSAGTQSASLSALTFANSNNLSFGLNAGVITGSFLGTVPTLGIGAGTNTITSGTAIFQNSNGISFGMNTAGVVTGSYTTPSTAGLLSNIKFSAGTQSSNLSALTLSNSNGLSFGLNAGTVTASFAAIKSIGFGDLAVTFAGPEVDFYNGVNASFYQPGGGKIAVSVAGPVTLSTYEPYPLGNQGGAATVSMNSATGSQSMFPFEVHAPVAAEYGKVAFSASIISAGTDNFKQSITMGWGIFSRDTGANSSQMGVIFSSSLSLRMDYSNSSMTITQPTSTAAGGSYVTGSVSSGGTALISAYTGVKQFDLGLNATLVPGAYWLGLHYFNSGGKGSGIVLSMMGGSQTLTGMAPLGSASAAYSTGTNVALDIGGNWHQAAGRFISGAQSALSTKIAISQITQDGTFLPYLKFATRL